MGFELHTSEVAYECRLFASDRYRDDSLGIGIKERCITKQAYMEDLEKQGFDPDPEKWASSYAAHEADIMRSGNLAIGFGALIVLSAFV